MLLIEDKHDVNRDYITDSNLFYAQTFFQKFKGLVLYLMIIFNHILRQS